MAKKKSLSGVSQPRMMELLLGNLKGLVAAPAEFYRWYHRRLSAASDELAGFADWPRIRACRDPRFREHCDNPRVCPYCWVRKVSKDVWSRWGDTPVEIYVFEDMDDLASAAISDAITAVAGGCHWFRSWQPTEARRYVRRTIFLVPCGALSLRAQFEQFQYALGIQREFLTAPVETWVGAVRLNLACMTSGMLGCVRGGKLHKLPLKPPLRDLNPGLYSELTAQPIQGDDPEEEAASVHSAVATIEDGLFLEIAYLYQRSGPAMDATGDFQAFVDRARTVKMHVRVQIVEIIRSVLQPATLEKFHELIQNFRLHHPAGTLGDFLSQHGPTGQ